MIGLNILCLFVSILLKFNSEASFQTTQGFATDNNQILLSEIRNGTCRFAPGLTVGDEPRVIACCNGTVSWFEFWWSEGQFYLTTYLQSLQSWGCPQFEEQCKLRLFAVNEYTERVYDFFCSNYTDFIERCYDDVNAVIVTYDASYISNHSWENLISELNSSELSLEQLNVPCVQVALYIAEGEHFGEFHEVIRLNLPSCEPTWCGYDGETLRSRIITVWTCMSQRYCLIIIQVCCTQFYIGFSKNFIILANLPNYFCKHWEAYDDIILMEKNYISSDLLAR